MKKYLLLFMAIISAVNLLAQNTPAYTSLAVGTSTIASGANSFATGSSSQSLGLTSIAMGHSTIANSPYSIAMGYGSQTNGQFSIAMGNASMANGLNSIAIGNISRATAENSIAIGNGIIANGKNSIAMGTNLATNGRTGSFCFGDYVGGSTTITNPFGNDADNQMMMRFVGGYKFYLDNTKVPFSINSNGNVGVGTSTPGAKFSLSTTGEDLGGSVPSKTLRTYSGVLGTNAGAEIKLASFGFKSGNWTSLGITAYRYNGADGWPNAAILFGYDVDNTPGAGSFFTLAGNGNFGVGTASPSHKLTVAGNILATGSITPSDARYKKNILPISGALNTIMSLSAYSYLLKKEDFPEMNFDKRTQFGLLAQDVESVLPEIIYTGNDGYKGIDYTRIVPFLVEGMKEQQKAIEKQQQQIDELKKMVEALIKK